jgi:hypothetical protein
MRRAPARAIFGAMPDRSKKPSRPRDANQLAKRIVEIAAGDEDEKPRKKDPAAVSLGRRGGLKGGKARAEALTAERRSEIAARAAKVRWKDKK